LDAAKANADAQIQAVKDWQKNETDALRTLVADNLTKLTTQEDGLLKEQIARLDAQKELLTRQLEQTVGVDQARAILSDPTVGLVYLSDQINKSVGDLDTNINRSLGTVNENLGTLHDDLVAFLGSVQPLAGGFSGDITRPKLFLIGERGPEHMEVGPAGAVPAAVIAGQGGGGRPTINYSPQYAISIPSGTPSEMKQWLLQALAEAREQDRRRWLSSDEFRYAAQKATASRGGYS
jgi:hypothetical protein